jgi:hypothetical protein
MIPQVPYNTPVNYGPNGYGGGGRYQNKVSDCPSLQWLLPSISYTWFFQMKHHIILHHVLKESEVGVAICLSY